MARAVPGRRQPPPGRYPEQRAPRGRPRTCVSSRGLSRCPPTPQNSKRRQIALPPSFRNRRKLVYFRLVIAVRSTESLAMPVAPHQFDPVPFGLIGVTLVVPEALKAPVNALQLPLLRSVSE